MIRSAGGIRISDFISDGTVPSSAYLTFVYAGTNYKVPYEDFITGLGVTGTIEQIGDGTTNILDTQGTVNYIRNIADGAGIITSIDAEENVVIAHNFTISATGNPLVINGSAASPTILSLVAGAGVTITPSGTTLIISSP